MENSDLTCESPRAIASMSRSLDPAIGIVVCIPCFRRPEHLRQTLQSLVDQRTDRRFAVAEDVPSGAQTRIEIRLLGMRHRGLANHH